MNDPIILVIHKTDEGFKVLDFSENERLQETIVAVDPPEAALHSPTWFEAASAIATRFLLGLLMLYMLPACTTKHQQELITIGDKALAIAEATGQITPAQAAAARQAGKLLLTKDESILHTPEPTTK